MSEYVALRGVIHEARGKASLPTAFKMTCRSGVLPRSGTVSCPTQC